MRYLYFAEGCCFVALAMLLRGRGGLPGIILCSILCTVLFSNLYGWRRSHQYFNASYLNLIWGWIRPTWKLVALLTPLVLMLWFVTTDLPSIWRLAIHSAVASGFGGILFLRLGLPPETVRDTAIRLPRPIARVLAVVVPDKA